MDGSGQKLYRYQKWLEKEKREDETTNKKLESKLEVKVTRWGGVVLEGDRWGGRKMRETTDW